MNRLIELLLGLEHGFLSRQGELSLQFNPRWPLQTVMGAGLWNAVLVVLAGVLVWYVYRREGQPARVRVILASLRLVLLGLLIVLLNRPVLTLGQNRVEPSVLAVLIDDSLSMRVRDVVPAPGSAGVGRLDAVLALLQGNEQRVVRELAKQHSIRFFRFNQNAEPIASVEGDPSRGSEGVESSARDFSNDLAPLTALKPTGQNTQVLKSVQTVLKDLQGQRVAGVVVLTDGRDTPAGPQTALLDELSKFNVKVYPIVTGSDRAPLNVSVQSVAVQDSAFKGDIVNVRAQLAMTGVEPGQQVRVVLKDKRTGRELPGLAGATAEQLVIADGSGRPTEVELQFKPEVVGPLDVVVEAAPLTGEVDDDDNARVVQVAVLDAKINVLYVDGYPRWEYRYIRTEMIRDKSVDISLLLTSADVTFAQEGDRPIKRFPESIEELLDYDAVVFGDVDPRQFTDNQLQIVADFVSRRGGGFGMIAGPRFSPQQWRNTPIESILPVNIDAVQPTPDGTSLTEGFRPTLTREGAQSSIYRFFADRAENEKYLLNDIPALFWYCQGVTAKPGVGEVFAEHPSDVGPDGRKSPILVLGRFGAGRTLFSAIDDSWRWRYYTGESVFTSYWVQQFRYLSRSKKLGQRKFTLASNRPTYELGEQVRLSLRILDPQLQGQLPEQLRVEVWAEGGEQGSAGSGSDSPSAATTASAALSPSAPTLVRQETLQRQEGQSELFTGAFTADRIGRFTVRLPPIASGTEAVNLPVQVIVPKLELSSPQVDRPLLSRLASETAGQSIDLKDAAEKLPTLVPSAAKIIPVETTRPLWDAPLAMALFVATLATEWIVRKLYGMV